HRPRRAHGGAAGARRAPRGGQAGRRGVRRPHGRGGERRGRLRSRGPVHRPAGTAPRAAHRHAARDDRLVGWRPERRRGRDRRARRSRAGAAHAAPRELHADPDRRRDPLGLPAAVLIEGRWRRRPYAWPSTRNATSDGSYQASSWSSASPTRNSASRSPRSAASTAPAASRTAYSASSRSTWTAAIASNGTPPEMRTAPSSRSGRNATSSRSAATTTRRAGVPFSPSPISTDSSRSDARAAWLIAAYSSSSSSPPV